jgi:hypothetical protein
MITRFGGVASKTPSPPGVGTDRERTARPQTGALPAGGDGQYPAGQRPVGWSQPEQPAAGSGA